MAIPRRITGTRKLVAMCDPSLATFPQLKTKMLNGVEVPDIGLVPYGTTLDIAYLGDLSELPGGGPTVFEVMPMQTRFMSWDRGENTDHVAVFQMHVVGVENFDAKPPLSWETIQGVDHKTLDEKSVEQFPMSFIVDISHMIIQLAKGDGQTIPFSTLGSSSDILRRCRAAQFLNLSHVHTAAVKPSK